MEFLKLGQASLVFLILIFILSLSFSVLFGFIFVKEINLVKFITTNAQLFFSQQSILNFSLEEIFNNEFLPETEKSLSINKNIISYFNLPAIEPETKMISGFVSSKALLIPLQWRFNFMIEKDNQELKNLRIIVLE